MMRLFSIILNDISLQVKMKYHIHLGGYFSIHLSNVGLLKETVGFHFRH